MLNDVARSSAIFGADHIEFFKAVQMTCLFPVNVNLDHMIMAYFPNILLLFVIS